MKYILDSKNITKLSKLNIGKYEYHTGIKYYNQSFKWNFSSRVVNSTFYTQFHELVISVNR